MRLPGMETAKKIIAIVDDDVGILGGIARLLIGHGFGVQTFLSGEAFLASASLAVPDCLVSDIQLGGISGMELRRRLTAAGSGIPVIFITALDDDPTFRQAREAGCVAYLRKPFEADLLLAAINEALVSAHLPRDDVAPISQSKRRA
jgi:FixJ family two-component response regulator